MQHTKNRPIRSLLTTYYSMMMMMMMMSAWPANNMPPCSSRNGIMNLLHLSIFEYLFFRCLTTIFLIFVSADYTALYYCRLSHGHPAGNMILAYSNYGPTIYPVNSLGCPLSFCSNCLHFENQRITAYLFIRFWQDMCDHTYKVYLHIVPQK